MNTVLPGLLDAWKKDDRIWELMPDASFVLGDHISGADVVDVKHMPIGCFHEAGVWVIYMLATDDPNETSAMIRATDVGDLVDRVIGVCSVMCGQSTQQNQLIALTYSICDVRNYAHEAIFMWVSGYFKNKLPLTSPPC